MTLQRTRIWGEYSWHGPWMNGANVSCEGLTCTSPWWLTNLDFTGIHLAIDFYLIFTMWVLWKDKVSVGFSLEYKQSRSARHLSRKDFLWELRGACWDLWVSWGGTVMALSPVLPLQHSPSGALGVSCNPRAVLHACSPYSLWGHV